MSDYNEKELFDLLEKEQKKKTAPVSTSKNGRENKDVLRFIRKKELERGEIKVPTYVIYYHYAIWRQSQWGKPYGKEEFFRTFKQRFEQKRSGNQRFYMINDALDLSNELYEKAKKYDQKWQNRSKNKKAKSKVSSPKQGNES
jgi:hypothetical protein